MGDGAGTRLDGTLCHRDIGDAIEMHFEKPELDNLGHQRHRSVAERLAKGQESHQHANRQAVGIEDGSRAEIDHNNSL
ncbi:hypothetical protein D3C87_2117370 [compost metagenome]